MMKHIEPNQEHRKTEKMLITPAEACQLLGIGRTTMYKLIHTEVIPAVRLPGCRRIYLSVEALKQMIQDSTICNVSEIGGEEYE